MTAPMPETMSPREKVAAVLDPEIWADDMPVPTRAAVTDFHARRQASVIKADAILAALASSGDQIPGPDDVTAPSSIGCASATGEAAREKPPHSSGDHSGDVTNMIPGDHAELARLCGEANAATTMWHADKALRAIEQICSPDYLLALIAEVAALRSDNADLREHRITADLLVSALKADLADAERGRDEAVGLLSEVADEFGCTIEQYHKNGPHWTSADGEMFDVGVVLDREPLIERARNFLSKEAERG